MGTVFDLPAPAGQRDGAGRFLPGNRLGRGNPFVRQVARLKAALHGALTEEDVTALAQALLRKAREGDVAAARLLLEYAVGKPLPGALASAVDGEATQELDYGCLSVEELRAMYQIHLKLQSAEASRR